MTNSIEITAIVPEGNYDSYEDARAYADALIAVATAAYPDAHIDVSVAMRQTNGGSTRVRIDGDDDEYAADALDQQAAERWTCGG